MLDAKFTTSRVREISTMIQQEFSLRNVVTLQEFGGANISESAAVRELLKGQDHMLKIITEVKEDQGNL
jgi:hypothetical protein